MWHVPFFVQLFFTFLFLMGRQESGSRSCYGRSEQRKACLLEVVVTGDQVKLQNSSWQVELTLTCLSFVSKKFVHLKCCIYIVRGWVDTFCIWPSNSTLMDSERSQERCALSPSYKGNLKYQSFQTRESAK